MMSVTQLVVLFCNESLDLDGEFHHANPWLAYAGMWATVVSVVTALHFDTLITALTLKAKILNHRLEEVIEMVDSSKTRKRCKLNINMNDSRRNPASYKFRQCSATKDEAYKVVQIALYRLRLLSLNKAVSKLYGAFFLAFWFTSFVTITMMAHVFLDGHMSNDLIATPRYILIDFLTWTGSYQAITIKVLLQSDDLLKYDERSRYLAMELLLRSKDRNTRREVQILISQMYHGKLYLSAGGVFRLDCTVLKSMFAAIITYLCILMQFMPIRVHSKDKELDQSNWPD
ncbi:putative gustatory receptor 28b [Ischnura elegans]|uniref:putative gustatory receptor 28b n=1 Tax=Ischnura elegans TaxID=197161 RepID=UPI001ED873D3|nr:putative gustatory receptor 28b [Ischnura elegans]